MSGLVALCRALRTLRAITQSLQLTCPVLRLLDAACAEIHTSCMDSLEHSEF
jgi:hypothetical protein